MSWNRRLISFFLLIFFAASICLWPNQRKKKDEEEITQTLELPPDPPSAVTAETQRLAFGISPLSSKGLLSQQVRNGIKELWKQSKGASIVKLRAFVAGTGDMRRVQTVVSEAFTDKRLALPALSVVQVGALPLEGAQVVLESIGIAKKTVNPHGIAFISGQAASTDEAMLQVTPLAALSMSQIRKALSSMQLTSEDVMRVTCFCSSLQDIQDVRRVVSTEFPNAVTNFVQMQRAYTRGTVECESVARLKTPINAPVRLINPNGLPESKNYSHIAMVNTPRLVFSGTQLAFRYQDEDVRLAFERLSRALEQSQTSLNKVIVSNIYALSGGIAEKIRALRFEYFDKARPPASTMLLFEGLPSLDASFAVDVVAVPR